MAGFRFKLDFLLRFRRQREEMAMYELAKRIREAGAIQAELDNLRDRSGELASAIRDQSDDLIPVPVFWLYKSYLDDLRRRTVTTENALDRAEMRVEQQRQKLVAASVDRKVIEKYKDIKKESFLADQTRQEQNNLDELAVISASRKPHET